jgi:hypothetical protein
MKKWVIPTLLTVSFALAQAVNTYAEAPTVRDWPDVCIGDIESITPSVTQGNVFVFPNAFDVRNFFVSDDTATSTDVKWSFLQLSGNTILINGVGSLSGVGGALGSNSDPIQPPTSLRITSNNTDPGDTQSPLPNQLEDGNEFTLTFRDATLSPIAGPNTEPGMTGTVNTSVITVFASDMTTASQFNVIVKTVNDATDSLTGGIQLTTENNFDFSAGTFGWQSNLRLFTTVVTAAGAQGANGLCLTVNGATGGQAASWFGDFNNPDIELTSGKIYQLLADVFTDQTVADKIPLIDFNVSNIIGEWGNDAYFVDASGGAAGFDRPQGIDVANIWVTPMAVSIPAWATGAFQPAEDALNDGYIVFSVLNFNPGIAFANDAGTVCLKSLRISSGNVDDLNGSVVFDSVPNTTDNTVVSIVDSVNAGDNALPHTATIDGSGAHFAVAAVGNNNSTLGAPYKAVGFAKLGRVNDQPPYVPDLSGPFPIPWNSNVLLEAQITMTSESGGSDPVNVVESQFTNPNFEVGSGGFISAGVPGGEFDMQASPTVGEDRVWRHFLFTHNVTLTPDGTNGYSNFDGFEVIPALVNSPNIHGFNTGADPVLLKRVRVYEHVVPTN